MFTKSDGSGCRFSVSEKERQFLGDFVSATEETSGGRLARWLQPESVADPHKSQLLFPGIFSASLSPFGQAVAKLPSSSSALLAPPRHHGESSRIHHGT